MLSFAFRPFAMPAIVLLAGLLAAGFMPGQDATAGGNVEPKKYVTGWLPYWNPDAAIRSVRQNSAVFEDASPFVFDAISTRRIDLKLDADDWRQLRAGLRQSGVDNIATVATDMSAADFARILRSPDRRSAHARALVKLVDRYNLDGIDLDYESINFGSSADKATIRANYPLLVRALDARLNSRSATTSVTMASRTSAKDPNWRVFDYAALGHEADRVRIMTYDFSWSGGSAGPIAPKWWVKDVASYASRAIAPRKVSLGMPAYGRDWFGGTVSGKCPASAKATVSRTTRGMKAFAQNIGVKPQWRERATSKYFTYVRSYSNGQTRCKAKRVVWFDDERSLSAKSPLVERYGLRGIAIWALGNESAASWDGINSFGRQLTRSR
jgi:spore germination protein